MNCANIGFNPTNSTSAGKAVKLIDRIRRWNVKNFKNSLNTLFNVLNTKNFVVKKENVTQTVWLIINIAMQCRPRGAVNKYKHGKKIKPKTVLTNPIIKNLDFFVSILKKIDKIMKYLYSKDIFNLHIDGKFKRDSLQ